MKGFSVMRKTISIMLGIIFTLTPLFGVSSAISFIEDFDSIEKASNSVLYIETDGDYDDEYVSTGSGFVAFNSKTFVTNYHVIEDAVRIHAFDEDYREFEVGEILAVDKERDIAIISFMLSTDLKPLPLAITPDLKRGQPVATIGYPKGLFSTFSTGIISAIIDFDNRVEIQFTAPISHGSSGGALFNENGEVIGITTSTIEDGQNINFAIKISHVISLYGQYISDLESKQLTTNMPMPIVTTGKSTPMLTQTDLPLPTLSPTSVISANPDTTPDTMRREIYFTPSEDFNGVVFEEYNGYKYDGFERTWFYGKAMKLGSDCILMFSIHGEKTMPTPPMILFMDTTDSLERFYIDSVDFLLDNDLYTFDSFLMNESDSKVNNIFIGTIGKQMITKMIDANSISIRLLLRDKTKKTYDVDPLMQLNLSSWIKNILKHKVFDHYMNNQLLQADKTHNARIH